MTIELNLANTCLFVLLQQKAREEAAAKQQQEQEEADVRLQGIAVDLIVAASQGRMEEAVHLSGELLVSGRGLDSRDQVSTFCLCHAMRWRERHTQYKNCNYVKHLQTIFHSFSS